MLWLANTCAISFVYRENRSGPRTEPCGTPQSSDESEDDESPCRTQNRRLERYDRNQSAARSVKPHDECSRWSKMLWSTVSKAADKSRRTRRDSSPPSAARSRSDVTLRSAVSVEWLER